VTPFPERAEPQGVYNDWLCNECTSPSFAVCVKISWIFGYLVTTWNYWERAKDFGMFLEIRYFTLK
jgi:hypothetical protein